jgi:hypothetical protein
MYQVYIVHKSVVTNMAVVSNFEAISDKLTLTKPIIK